MRTFPMLTAVALALSACSGEAPAPEASEVPIDTAPTSAPVDAVPTAEPSATTSATPSPTPSPSAPVTPYPTSSATPKPTPAASATPVAAAALPAIFARCAVCHNAEKGGADKLGPNLWGVAGSKAGQGGFAYSDAMKSSGVTWTDDSLDKYLENPKAFIPNNRMAFPGIKDPAKRAELIAWLKTRR